MFPRFLRDLLNEFRSKITTEPSPYPLSIPTREDAVTRVIEISHLLPESHVYRLAQDDFGTWCLFASSNARPLILETVYNLHTDVEAQVAEDVCGAHREFCCPLCFDQSTVAMAFEVEAVIHS